jgi:ubiquinone/menaquinone biosynthesis C-methylase UbiE
MEAMDANSDVFSNVAEFYDTYRPSPPAVLPGLLAQLAQVAIPSLVIDFGSGTGLSTVMWEERAKAVIGIEPNHDMLQVARRRITSLPSNHTLSFQQGVASQTGLPDECADIVTCSQSFHWMEPQSTLAEIARILRPGGVFAAYDHQWPPTLGWQAERAYETFNDHAWALKGQRGLEQDLHIWLQNRHLPQLQESGHFRYVKELWLHQQETGNADRFIGLALTNGVIQYLQNGLLSEDEIGLASFKQEIQKAIGSEPTPWYFSYHVRIGIK